MLVGLGEHWNLLDLAVVARTPGPVGFVVVARAGLGTLNHAELTVAGDPATRGLDVAGVVVGSWPDATRPGRGRRTCSTCRC